MFRLVPGKAVRPLAPKEGSVMTVTLATWTVELTCDCPTCGEYVDLLDHPDFWDGRQLDVPEHGTERSQRVEVTCPKCFGEFIVTCEY